MSLSKTQQIKIINIVIIHLYNGGNYKEEFIETIFQLNKIKLNKIDKALLMTKMRREELIIEIHSTSAEDSEDERHFIKLSYLAIELIGNYKTYSKILSFKNSRKAKENPTTDTVNKMTPKKARIRPLVEMIAWIVGIIGGLILIWQTLLPDIFKVNEAKSETSEFEQVNRPYVTITKFAVDTTSKPPYIHCSFDAVNTGKFPATMKSFNVQSIIGSDTLNYVAIGDRKTAGRNEFLPFNGVFNLHNLIVLPNPYKAEIFLGGLFIFLKFDYEYVNTSLKKEYKNYIVYKISFVNNEMNAERVISSESEKFL